MDDQQPQKPIHSRRSYIYDSNGGKKNKKKYLAIIGGIIIVIIVLIIGSAVFSGEDASEEEDIFATPAITQAPTDTPTPTSEEDSEEDPQDEEETEEGAEEESDSTDEASDLDRADYSILIQNGSGTAGAAGRLSDTLSDLGYDVAGTENADNFEYEETEISVANGNEALLALLEEDIGDEYVIGNTSTEYDGTADAVIIIGAE